MTTPTDKLVERLRSLYTIQGLSVIGDRCQEAADMIEQQAARIEAMREALELADATLRGANMNRNVVERKVSAALKLGEDQ